MRLIAPLLALLAASMVGAQGFGDPTDRTAPVEIAAEQLVIDESAGTAELIGEVVIAQGTMRLSAPRVFVVYAEGPGEIARMEARGGVLIVSANDAAEAREANYDLSAGLITLRGDVLVNRSDGSTLAGDMVVINLNTGRAEARGRVRTILTPGTD